MAPRRIVKLTVIACLLLAGSAASRAATYLVPPDDALIARADLIVRGRVLDGASLRDARGGIVTDVRIAVESVLRGRVDGGVLVVREIGGVVGEDLEVYPGTGAFGPRDHALLLLETRPGEPPRLLHFALGKFLIDRTAGGEEYAWRPGISQAAAAGGGTWVEPARSLPLFERHIADLGADPALSPSPAAAGSPDYILPGVILPEWTAAPAFELLQLGGGVYARWTQFDSGGSITYRYDAAGALGGNCPSGCDTETAAGMTAWNADTGSDIMVVSGGADASIGGKCKSSLSNEINYDDPCSEISDLSGCAGTLAVGGFSATSGQTSSGCPAKSSAPYYKITEGRIMVNNGVGACIGSCNFQDMIAHETGHSLGFDHSSDNSALMAPFLVSGRCGALQADDAAGAACLYPAAGCIPPDATSAKVKEKKTGAVKVSVLGLSFSAGDTIQIDSGSGFVDVPGTIFKSSKKVFVKDASAFFPDASTVQVRVLKAAGCTGSSVPASR